MPTPAPNTYSFDGSGTVPANLVQGELHTLTVINFRDYHYIIPNFAPFFAESLVVEYRDDPIEVFTTLNDGIDYYPALQYVGATRATAKPVYGAISFNNLSLSGEIRLTYQTVGGEWTLDVAKLTELTANIIYNPRTTTWEQVSGAPAHFPPLAHAWQLDDMVGQAEVVDALNAIHDAMIGADADADLLNHISNFSNPHRVSKSQVGLGKVQNYSPATIAETIAAASAELYVTPLGLKAFIDSLGLDQTLNFVSLQEVVDRVPVAKILTFDLFLEYMRLYGDGDAVVTPQSNDPIIVYPTEQSTYIKDQIFKCTTFKDTTPGTVNRIINLTGNGTHSVPAGTGLVKITGRGGIGGVSTPTFLTKTEVLSETGNGTFTVPAGGNILSIRGRGAAGTIGRTRRYSVDNATFVPEILTVDNPNVQVHSIVVNQITGANDIEFGAAFTMSVSISVTFSYNVGPGPIVPQTCSGNAVYSFAANDNGTSHGFPSVSGNGNYWILTSPPELTSDHESLLFAETINPAIPTIGTGAPDNLALKVRGSFTMRRQVGNVALAGVNATTTINGALRTYSGSSTTSIPAERVDEVPTVPTISTVVNYSTPPGTLLELVYQDYSAIGVWEIKRYYSSKITNPTTGTGALVEDTDGTIVALAPNVTGDYMVDRTSIVNEITPAIDTAYALQLVAANSNSTRRVFEYRYTLTGTDVTIRVVADLLASTANVSQGASAVVSLLGRTETYQGSADNNSVPQTRTDEVVLGSGAETIITYACPTGTSVVLNYNEPNSSQPITHSDTIWEISTSNDFTNASTVEGTVVVGKGSIFTLTQWKPTSTNVLINNTDYYVRVKWVKSDASQSNWSEIKRFTYSTGVTHPARDTELSRFCRSFDQWGTFADGNGGSYEREISKNAVACGYVVTTPPPTVSNAVLNNVTLISSLSTIPIGGTSVLTVSFKDTIPGRSYRFAWYQKQSVQPDSAYVKSTHPVFDRAYIGDASTSTTIITVPLAHDGSTQGVFNGKVVLTDESNAANTAESNPVTITFARNGGVTPPPSTLQPTAPPVTFDPNAITIATTMSEIRAGVTERLTVYATGAVPNVTLNADIYSFPTTLTIGSVPDSTWAAYKIGTVAITTNASGTGSRSIDNYVTGVSPAGTTVGGSSAFSHVAGAYRTFAFVTGIHNPGKSNEIFRTFIAATAASKKLTIVASPTSIGVGQASTIQFNLTDMDPNTNYNLETFYTPPGGAKTILGFNTINTNSGGSGSGITVFTNNGNLAAGNHLIEATVKTQAGAVVALPGGNSPATIMVQLNSSVAFVSNYGDNPNIPVGAGETLTVSIGGAAVNTTLACVVRYQWMSGNNTGTTSRDVEFNLTTNASGTGVVTIPAGNNGSFSTPSVWSRKIIVLSTGLASETKTVNFISPAAAMSMSIASSKAASGVPQIAVGEAETIALTVTGGPVNQTISVNLRTQYVSGNSTGVTAGVWYSNYFNVTTNSIGYGTISIPAGNNGSIATPSSWRRQVIYEPTGVTSNEILVNFV